MCQIGGFGSAVGQTALESRHLRGLHLAARAKLGFLAIAAPPRPKVGGGKILGNQDEDGKIIGCVLNISRWPVSLSK